VELQALATRLEAANVEAERARAEAQEASRVKSEFLAVMSHEIRTPINVVVSYVELLKAGVPDQPTEKQRLYLHRIDQSSQLLVWLLNDLLDFSRIESGQMGIEMGVGSARDAVQDALLALELFAESKGIALTSRCEEGVRFHADPQRVQQIVLNLLSNAIKFTPSGGSVTVSCAVSDVPPPRAPVHDRSWVRIDVTDTGVGIPPDRIAQMFEPFVRGDAERTGGTTGAGLGLAISQRLADMMSGVITVDSAGERGTRFTLWLQKAQAEARSQPTVGSTSAPRPRGRPAGEGEPAPIR
jgi:signal transduction histidine kinase